MSWHWQTLQPRPRSYEHRASPTQRMFRYSGQTAWSFFTCAQPARRRTGTTRKRRRRTRVPLGACPEEVVVDDLRVVVQGVEGRLARLRVDDLPEAVRALLAGPRGDA